MAIVRGPLLSIGASGTVAKILTFNQSNRRVIARRKPHNYPPPTLHQTTIRTEVKAAATAWNQLTQQDRNQWNGISYPRLILPFGKYTLEWFAQHSDADHLPFIPVR